MKLAEAKLPFLADLKANNPLTTFKSFQAAINRYERRLHEQGLTDLDLEYAFAAQTLEEYKNYLSTTCSLKGQTVRAQFSALKCFWKYLAMKGWVSEDADPFCQIALPKKVDPVRERTNDREVELLFEATLRNHSEREVAFNRLLLSTLVLTGVRCEELTNIKVTHVDENEETLEVINGKGGKNRTLHPNSAWFVTYRSFMVHRNRMGCSTPYLFALGPKMRIADEKVRERIEQLKAVAGLKGRNGIKPHSLRHYFAKNMEKNQASLEAIQHALGHENLETTLIYLKSGGESAKEMKQCASLPYLNLPTSADAPEPGADTVTTKRTHQAELNLQVLSAAPQDRFTADVLKGRTDEVCNPPTAASADPVVAVPVPPEACAAETGSPVSAVESLRRELGLDTDFGLEPPAPELPTLELHDPEPPAPQARTRNRVDLIAPHRRVALPSPHPFTGHERTRLRLQDLANRRYGGRT